MRSLSRPDAAAVVADEVCKFLFGSESVAKGPVIRST
jgi:hypothetical protein